MIDVHKYAMVAQGETPDDVDKKIDSLHMIVVDPAMLANITEKDLRMINIDIGMWVMHELLAGAELDEEEDTEFAFLQKGENEKSPVMFDSAKFPSQISIVELYSYYASNQEPISSEDLNEIIHECATQLTIDEMRKENQNPENN